MNSDLKNLKRQPVVRLRDRLDNQLRSQFGRDSEAHIWEQLWGCGRNDDDQLGAWLLYPISQLENHRWE